MQKTSQDCLWEWDGKILRVQEGKGICSLQVHEDTKKVKSADHDQYIEWPIVGYKEAREMLVAIILKHGKKGEFTI